MRITQSVAWPFISSSTFPLSAMQTLALALTLTILSAASATIVDQRNPCTPFADTFDDRNTGLLPLLSPVGAYHGLDYPAFTFSAPNATAGVQPVSKSNLITATLQTDET